MLIPKAAKRYAQAWYKRAEEAGKLEVALKDSQHIKDVIGESSELQQLLKNKVISDQKKKEVLDSLFSNQISDITQELITLLLDKNREELLETVASAFIESYNVHHGIIDVEIRYPIELEEDHIKQLTKVLEQKTGKNVVLNYIHDPDLIGGLTIRIGDTVIDGSVRNKLQKLDALFHGTAA